MVALDDLKQGIRTQTEEVWGKTSALQNTCQDWRFANQLNSDVCSSTRSHAFGAFYRWSLIQPLLKIWMATDSQVSAFISSYNIPISRFMLNIFVFCIDSPYDIRICPV